MLREAPVHSLKKPSDWIFWYKSAWNGIQRYKSAWNGIQTYLPNRNADMEHTFHCYSSQAIENMFIAAEKRREEKRREEKRREEKRREEKRREENGTWS